MKILLFLFITLQPGKVIFDIPRLSSQRMDQIKKILGKPKYDDMPTDYQARAGATGDAFFEKDGFTLEITYNPANKKVIDFFISKEHSVKDYVPLEIAGNVYGRAGFLLSPVRENKNPSLFTGVTVTPK